MVRVVSGQSEKMGAGTCREPCKKRLNRSRCRLSVDFNEARDDGVALASAEACASHLHLAADR